MTYNILVCTPLSEDGLALLHTADDAHIVVTEENEAAVREHLLSAHAIILGNELHFDADLIDRGKNLRIIARAGSPLTNVDVDHATKNGIIVMNTPGVDAVTMAEYTFALLLALVRNVLMAHRNFPMQYIGTQLKGKTLGILGYGQVGSKVASRAIAFGMDVLVNDPYIPERRVAGQRLKIVNLDEILRRSDILTLHTSVVPDTEHLINGETIATMRDDVFIINNKHHSLMDESAVLKALDSGKLAGVALDDFAPTSKSPLIGHPRVLHTHNMRSNTHEAQRDLSTLLVPQLLDALRGSDYRNAVNLPFMPGNEYENIQPHLAMAEKIGLLQHHLGRRAGIEKVEISITGEEMIGMVKPLTVAFLCGLLRPRCGDYVNYINAPILAAENNIVVGQNNRLNLDSYPDLLTVRVIWVDGGEMVFAGAIFDQTEPRIVQVDQYRTDFVPEGIILIMGSYDVPGVIGQVGTYMADHAINIAGWRTSREEKGGNTISIISIDEPLSEQILAGLRRKDFVRHVTQIVF